jgi:hypothetical protein
MPRHVVDDGKKLYSVYSEVTLFGTVPLLRMLGPHGPQLVHARQYLNVVIVDQLLATAELRVGTGERADTNRPALPSVTRLRLGRVLMLVLVSGSLLVGGCLWLLRTQGQPLTTALTDSAAWQPCSAWPLASGRGSGCGALAQALAWTARRPRSPVPAVPVCRAFLYMPIPRSPPIGAISWSA